MDLGIRGGVVSKGSIKRMCPLAAALWLFMAPALANDLYRCTALDAVSMAGGQFERNQATDYWRRVLTPIFVDTSTAVLRIGIGNQPPQRWEALQGASENWFVAHRWAIDFVAINRDNRDGQPVQFFLLWNGQFHVSGTCDQVR